MQIDISCHSGAANVRPTGAFSDTREIIGGSIKGENKGKSATARVELAYYTGYQSICWQLAIMVATGVFGVANAAILFACIETAEATLSF